MKPNNPHLHTTRLENVDLTSGGARFDLDGRAINLTGEAGAPSVAALRSFYQSALADYHARPAQAAPPDQAHRSLARQAAARQEAALEHQRIASGKAGFRVARMSAATCGALIDATRRPGYRFAHPGYAVRVG